MKLTQRLCLVRKGPWYKNLWKKKSNFRIEPARIHPSLLQNTNTNSNRVVNAVDEFGSKAPKEVWIPPNDPRFMFPPRPCDHKNYHVKKALCFDSDTHLVEGLKQAQILTNTLVNNGLPSDIVDFDHKYDQNDHLIQRIILQAHLWDTAREKLPRREKPADISVMNYKAEFGIPAARSVDILFSSFCLKCAQILSQENPLESLAKRLIRDHTLNTQYTFQNESIYLNSNASYLLRSSSPLKRFADESQVAATENMSIPDIFPMSPKIDLTRSHIYPEESSLGYLKPSSLLNHHTLFLFMSKDWTMDQRHASAIVQSYAHCIEQAKSRKDVHHEPICIQTVHTDGERFGFTCFQLNTLDTKSELGSLKNMAWVDSGALFQKVIPRRSMLRNTKYTNYDCNIFKKILAMYAG